MNYASIPAHTTLEDFATKLLPILCQNYHIRYRKLVTLATQNFKLLQIARKVMATKAHKLHEFIRNASL